MIPILVWLVDVVVITIWVFDFSRASGIGFNGIVLVFIVFVWLWLVLGLFSVSGRWVFFLLLGCGVAETNLMRPYVGRKWFPSWMCG